MIDLKDLISKYPDSVSDKNKLKGFLTDLYPESENRAYINLLLLVYDMDIINEIKNNTVDALFVSRFVKKTVDTYFFNTDKAEWAVKQWCKAFGYEEKPEKAADSSTAMQNKKTNAQKADKPVPASSAVNEGKKQNNNTDSEFANVNVGDYIKFGTYPQTAAGNDKTPIEWLVLAKQDDKALIISRYSLDCQEYNTQYTDGKWVTCSLREWLNSIFVNKAFRYVERNRIQSTIVTEYKKTQYNKLLSSNINDMVFILSIEEAEKYFSSNKARKCEQTDYAITQMALTYDNYKIGSKNTGWWWLRSPGIDPIYAAFVNDYGSVNPFGLNVDNGFCGVRPALWINLKSHTSSQVPERSIVSSTATATESKQTAVSEKQTENPKASKAKINILDFEIDIDGVLKKYKGNDENVFIPDCVKIIGSHAFNGKSLKSVTIPESITKIGQGAFRDCKFLTSVIVPDSVKIIDKKAFYFCESLTSITIPESVIKIGKYAFFGCFFLDSITILNSKTVIGAWAFSECSSLTIFCPHSSYAEEYANKNDIPIEYID